MAPFLPRDARCRAYHTAWQLHSTASRLSRRVPCWLVVLLLAVAANARADEPRMESRILADGDSESAWHSAEATMRPDATHAREGRAMRFHVDVNHLAGEPNYPIGWPRTYLPIAKNQRDWRGWDFVEFRIYADTSRERLPRTPLGFIVRSPDKPNSYHRPVHEAQKGQWAHVRIPIADMPDPAECTAVQFFVAESDYRHGDVLDFWIDDLALLRYAEPTIVAMRPAGRVHYADAEVIRVDVDLAGFDEDQTAELALRLVRDGQILRQSSAAVGPGLQTLPLQTGGKMQAGFYELQAQIAGSERAVCETVRIVPSPWEEVSP